MKRGQKSYLASVRAIVQRTGVSWRVAQLTYKANPASAKTIRGWSKAWLRRQVAKTESVIESDLLAFPDPAFHIKNKQAEHIEAELDTRMGRRQTIDRLTVEMEQIDRRGGKVVRRKIKRVRRGVRADQFWQVYHDMVREGMKRDSKLAIITTRITAL